MAIRQYIGARYVLKIYENSQDPQSADWEAGVVYEPLVMVNYNNSSYISRKTVPANIGNPVANPTYWALSGLYNGQIANLQQQINTIDGEVDDHEDRIDAIEKDMGGRVFLFMGDSYDVTTDYLTSIGNYIKCKSFTKRSHTGAGFFKYNSPYDNYTYYNMLNSIDPLTQAEKDTVTDVVFCVAVGNDNPQSVQDLVNALNQMDVFLRANLTKLQRIHLYPVGWSAFDPDIQLKIRANLNTYSHTVPRYGWIYKDCTQIMRFGAWLNPSDSAGYHPAQTAGDYMAYAVANAITTGSDSFVMIRPGFSFVYTPTFPASGWGSPTITSPSNGKITFYGRITKNGEVELELNTFPIVISSVDIPAGRNTMDIELSPDGFYGPFPQSDHMLPINAFNKEVVAAGVLWRPNSTLRIRIFTDTDTAISNRSIQLLGGTYTINY